MKRFISVIVLLLALIGVSNAQNSLVTVCVDKFYKGNKTSFAKLASDLHEKFVAKGFVTHDEFLLNPTFAEVDSVVRSLEGRGILYFILVTDGIGYLAEEKTPFYGLEQSSTFQNIEIKGLVGIKPYPANENVKIKLGVPFVQLLKGGGRIYSTYTYDWCKMVASKIVSADTVASKSLLAKETFFLSTDTEEDTIIKNYIFDDWEPLNREYRQLQQDQKTGDLCGEFIGEESFGLNSQVDNDPQGLKDQLFTIQVDGQWHLACDLNQVSTSLEDLHPELVDTDDDGDFEFVDLDHDGREDKVGYANGIMLADGAHNSRELINTITSNYNGKIVLINAACYGAGVAANCSEGMVGLSVGPQFGTTDPGKLQFFTQAVDAAENNETVLDIINRFHALSGGSGYLNDNGDGVVTTGPWTGVKGEDGYLSSQIILVPAPEPPKPEKVNPLAENLVLHQNYPNPFNATTEIRYEIGGKGPVTLAIYNIMGQRIATLVDGYQNAGVYKASWNGRDGNGVTVPSGVYFCRLVTEWGEAQTIRIALTR